MIALDEDALVCDLAETYGIYDYRQLPPSKVAVFFVGLREDSRMKMKLSGSWITLETLLMANITDTLRMLYWAKTKDGSKGKNRPELILPKLFKSESEIKQFSSGEDFEKMRNELIGGE